MPQKCCVRGCHSNYQTPYVTTFRFPKDKEMRKLWIRQIPQKNFTPNNYSVICENHFQDSDLIHEGDFFISSGVCQPHLDMTFATKLKPDAVPSKFKKKSQKLSVHHSHEKSNKRQGDVDSSVKQATDTKNANITETMDDSTDSVISSSINEEKEDSLTDAEIVNIKNETIDDNSDSVISCDMDGEKEDSSSLESSESSCNDERQMSTGPVLSLMCLHEDDEVEIVDNDKSGIVDTTEIPELLIDSSDDENTENIVNGKKSTESETEDFERMKEVSEEVSVNENELSEMEEHPNLISVKIESVSSNVSLSSSSRPSISLPARTSFEGVHHFRISIVTNYSGKTENAVYYESKNKLYVCKDQPFKVIVNADGVPAGSIIKVVAIFSMAEFSNEIVQRCAIHAQQDYLKGHPAYLHLVQSFSDAAFYDRDKNGLLSVSVPYEEPQIGEAHTTYLFKVTCFSSCAGSINRRPFMLVFTLLHNDILLGRQVLETKVCACPSRDYKVDLKKDTSTVYKSRGSPISSKSNQNKPIVPEQAPSMFTMTMKDPELYQFLKDMKAFYETSAYVKHLANVPENSSLPSS